MYKYKAKVISVTDGNLIRADVDLGFSVVLRNQPVQLAGISAPKLHGGDTTQHYLARAARDELQAMIDLEPVLLESVSVGESGACAVIKSDKYPGTTINQMMLDLGLALPWPGKGGV